MPSIKRLERDSDGRLPAYAWPGGCAIGYLDREDSVLCPACATISADNPDEVPQFKPRQHFIIEGADDEPTYCGQCSEQID